MKKLYRFYWDCGRMGDLEGIFVSTDEEIKRIIGQEIYFGEVLGKHSEIVGIIKENDITVVTDDQEFIEKAAEYGLVPTGYNPFSYWDEE